VIFTAALPEPSVLTLPSSLVSQRQMDRGGPTEVTNVPLGVTGSAVVLAVGVEVGASGDTAVPIQWVSFAGKEWIQRLAYCLQIRCLRHRSAIVRLTQLIVGEHSAKALTSFWVVPLIDGHKMRDSLDVESPVCVGIEVFDLFTCRSAI
jgi:hypothetical protein